MTQEVTMIEDCEARESHLTEWEREFIDSIKARLASNRALTEKQAEHLDRIWSRVTSAQPSVYRSNR